MPFVNFCLCSQCSFCSFGKSLPKVRKIKVKLRPSRFSSPLWGRSGPKRKGQKSPNISLWIFGLVQKVSFPSFFHLNLKMHAIWLVPSIAKNGEKTARVAQPHQLNPHLWQFHCPAQTPAAVTASVGTPSLCERPTG